MTEDRLNALAVLSIEKKFVQSIPDFYNKVIEIFFHQESKENGFYVQKIKESFFVPTLIQNPRAATAYTSSSQSTLVSMDCDKQTAKLLTYIAYLWSVYILF
nr:unnamed protein product [Callosobruchus chinensis]